MTYRDLLKRINTMSERELKDMLDGEMDGRKRWSFVLRLHQRYCALRDARERRELLSECT